MRRLLTYSYLNNDYYIDVNRFKLPINNKGILAAVDIEPYGLTGTFDGGSIIYSGGFGLSGYSNGKIWSNGVIATSLIEDYLPGVIGSSESDPHNAVYVVKSTDDPFGFSWELWAYAVKQGAKFLRWK